MIFLPLASSSKGNAYVVAAEDTTILLEAGLPMRELRKRLPLPVTELDAVFITHEHMDHAKCARKLCDMGIPIYMSEGTATVLELEDANILEPHEVVAIGPLRIMAFDVYHDTPQPFGYAVEAREKNGLSRLLFAIDTCNLNVRWSGLTGIAIECNYADDLLGRLDRLQDKVKKRIRHTHMEVDTAIRCVKRLDVSGVRDIWLMHMSSASGDAGRFREAFEREFPGVRIHVCKE